MIGDRRADVAKCVGQGLEAAAVLRDGEITLVQAVEFLLSVNGPLHTIVEKNPGNGLSNAVGGVIRLEDDVEDLLGDGGVEPGHDVVVDLHPLCISYLLTRIGGAVNMIA